MVHINFIMVDITYLQPSTMPFNNLGYTLLKTLTMTIGEFDEVDHVLYRVPNVIEFEFSTYLLWLIFVVVMAILLQNMLVDAWTWRIHIVPTLYNQLSFFVGWTCC